MAVNKDCIFSAVFHVLLLMGLILLVRLRHSYTLVEPEIVLLRFVRRIETEAVKL